MVPLLVTVTLRSLTPLDVPAARVLAQAVLDTVPRSEPFRAAVDAALSHAGDEHQAIVAHTRRGLIGLIVFGETAGAHGAGRISFVAVEPRARRRGVALALIEAACADVRARGARFMAIELADDPALDAARALAFRAAFRREARVDDYVSEGVGLELLRRDLATAG
jgi:ribosomal protein S18 acetylase RimI-like enzyme